VGVGTVWVVVKGAERCNVLVFLTKSNAFARFPATHGFAEERIWDMLWIFGS
jgi:hypothetical protein